MPDMSEEKPQKPKSLKKADFGDDNDAKRSLEVIRPTTTTKARKTLVTLLLLVTVMTVLLLVVESTTVGDTTEYTEGERGAKLSEIGRVR